MKDCVKISLNPEFRLQIQLLRSPRTIESCCTEASLKFSICGSIEFKRKSKIFFSLSLTKVRNKYRCFFFLLLLLKVKLNSSSLVKTNNIYDNAHFHLLPLSCPSGRKFKLGFFSHFNYQHMIISRILLCSNFKRFGETGEAELGAETLDLS